MRLFLAQKIYKFYGGDEMTSIIFSTHRVESGVVKGVGGFADRLKGFAIARLISHALGKEFRVEWDSPFPLSDNFTLHDGTWHTPLDDKTSTITLDLIDEGVDVLNQKLADLLSGEYREKNIKIYANILYKPQWEVLLRYFPSFLVKYNELDCAVHDTIKSSLEYTPRDTCMELLDKFNESISAHSDVIALQIRVGGERTWRDPPLSDPNDVPEIASKIIDMHGKIPSAVFVTADSRIVKQSAASALRMLGVQNIIYHDFEEIHIERSINTDRFLVDMTILDFICVSKCNITYFGRGDFGRIAAVYGMKPYYSYL
ncbi:hypothetical protein FF100_33930 [Methylobacterium terricola]|uniref:Uncharacterized protein n=1 Tax=Methylobacterium terricola TaxID=2583531 RepID=A0A5C4L6Z0_9HYPH|nr:hypothetical protein [Methylobacterium terricola]TNC06817.1 hypothetical protein FF100_33930 [Methylobacterium terricola]